MQDAAKKTELGLLFKSADSEMKERAPNDKEAFYNKIASEAEAAAYRNDSRSDESLTKPLDFLYKI